MAFNLSSVDLEVYFNVNVAVSTSLFIIVVLPPLLLCLLCILALIIAKEINTKIRINIFTAEICYWISYCFFYLGWPIRQKHDDGISCKAYVSLLLVSSIQKFTTEPLYAIHVYKFIKYGKKNVKWCAIVPLIIISWVLSTVYISVAFLNEFGAANSNGFCNIKVNSTSAQAIVFTMIPIGLVSTVTELICSILTIVYIKKNVLQENTDVKKSITKVLAYLATVSILSFSGTIIYLCPVQL